MTILLESAIRVTLITAAVAIVLFVMRIKTASARHAVWSSVVVLMLLLPAWLAWGPKASLPVLPPQAAFIPLNPVPPPLPAGPAETAPVISPVRQDGGYAVVPAIYLLGLGVLLLRLAIGTIRASRLKSCVAPVTVGLLRPKIILPECSREWPQGQLDAVLAHEGEHVRRRDPLFQWLALLNRAIFWFHPLAWWLERRLSGLAEEACDAAVIAHGHDPSAYSRYLLDLARSVQRAGTRIEAIGMAMPGIHLPRRIRLILSGIPAPRISRTRMAWTAGICAVASAVLAVGTPVQAQLKRLQFEAVSIKSNRSGDLRTSAAAAPDRGTYTAENHSVKQLIRQAYGLKNLQLEGGPKWIDDNSSDRFDVIAKAAGPVSKDQLMAMLQTMLEDRFGLMFHRETRQLAIYALVPVKRGVLGPDLRDAASTDSRQSPVSGPHSHLRGRNATMQDLASYLSGVNERLIVDRTGLTGHYDFILGSMPEPDSAFALAQAKGLKLSPPPENTPSIFTALQEQLGLKLESARGPVDVIIIDHVEEPSEN